MLDACTANPADNASITDLSLNNPLSTAQQSPWSQFFADADLSEVIKMDLVRTHPSEAFFQDPDTQARMLNVLFVWCKQHRDLSYRQGMNEIVAPILQQVQHDAEQQQQAKPLATLCGTTTGSPEATLSSCFCRQTLHSSSTTRMPCSLR